MSSIFRGCRGASGGLGDAMQYPFQRQAMSLPTVALGYPRPAARPERPPKLRVGGKPVQGTHQSRDVAWPVEETFLPVPDYLIEGSHLHSNHRQRHSHVLKDLEGGPVEPEGGE